MNMAPEIYVILPTYNNETTIERAMWSVLEQDYDGEIHLIVVENGCTDKTNEVIRNVCEKVAITPQTNYAAARKVTHLISANKGVVPAFNCGLDWASYEICNNKNGTTKFFSNVYVCRMDGDDAWYPDKLKKQINFFIKNPEIHVVGTQMRYVTPGEYVAITKTNNPLLHEEIFKSMLGGSNVVANPSALYKWEVMDKAGRLEDIFPYAEDYWFWLKVILTGHKFANLPDVLMDYTYEHKPHENPAVGQSVAQVAQFIYGYNQTFRKK